VYGMEIELWEGSLVSCLECHVNGGNENDKENNYVLPVKNEIISLFKMNLFRRMAMQFRISDIISFPCIKCGEIYL